MKILIVCDDYINISNKSGAIMINELALEFVNRKYSVTILTPSHLLKTKFKISIINKIQVVEFKSGKLKNVSKLNRVINELALSFKSLLYLKDWFNKNKHDYIVYYSPTIFFGPLIKYLKYLWNVNSYLILRDVFPQWAIDSGVLKNKSLITFFFKYFEKVNYSSANFIGMMSPKNVEWFKKKFKNKNVETLYNWTIYDKIESSSVDYKKKLNIENKIVFFYGGNIGYAQDISNLMRLIIKLKSNIMAHFVFVGNGDELELILDMKKKHQLTNLTYLKNVDQITYSQMLTSFDVGLFSLHRDHQTHNFPGKLIGYMKHSKPILGSCNKDNDLQKIINNNKVGNIFVNGDDNKLYKACISMIDSESKRFSMGVNGNKLLKEKFSVLKACNEIEKHFIFSGIK
jgi:glycosyltransferase involved in cell wall biosynthesis